ncbi:hypothetical protein HRR99_07310 [Agrobacterium vaccinii]|uniref:hypothetical protein n=1 Tax=Agrobacterium vaccinii TaxID=2735528 RepID=UPI001E565DD8|nr:hypothetical protein [Agrobacterium vaccinii]UHS61333.1 hypothetical protein HRR99_07310 [Agrobacterium vaccinii]
MLQNEHPCLPISTPIPATFHKDIDNLARWIRGSGFSDIEADFIIEAVLEYLDPGLPSIAYLYRRMTRRIALLSHHDDRLYDVPRFVSFCHYVKSLPPVLVALCRNNRAHPETSQDDVVLIGDRTASSMLESNLAAAADRHQRQ